MKCTRAVVLRFLHLAGHFPQPRDFSRYAARARTTWAAFTQDLSRVVLVVRLGCRFACIDSSRKQGKS